jgi:hypothetical protein
MDYNSTQIFVSKPIFTHWATSYWFQFSLSVVSAFSILLVIVPLSFKHEIISYPTRTDLFNCLVNIRGNSRTSWLKWQFFWLVFSVRSTAIFDSVFQTVTWKSISIAYFIDGWACDLTNWDLIVNLLRNLYVSRVVFELILQISIFLVIRIMLLMSYLNFLALVRKRNIPTERLPLVSEVSANFYR